MADDGFGTDLDEPAPAPAVAGEAESPSDAAESESAERRRRRRRGGRGRRRPRAETAESPVPATSNAPAEAVPEQPPEREIRAPEPDLPVAEDGWPDIEAPPAPEAREGRETREVREFRDSREGRETRGGRESREARETRQGHEDTEHRGRSASPPPPRPAPPLQESRPRRTHLPQPHGISDWFSPERLDACQRAIGYHFRDVSLLENALTHSSIKSDDRPSYERMEFLGDSVIGLVIASYLYDRLPDCDEGELTKIKSLVVSTDGLADAARAVGLERFLAVGRGIMMKDSVPKSLIADVFEGVVGAVYLDRGYETVRLYVLDLLHPHIDHALSDRGARNFKSVLQQVAQRDFGETPYYDVLREGGPEHARVFEVVAVVGKRRFAVARAPTKKDAEQAAAKLALQTILFEKSSRKSGAPRRRGRR